MRPVLLCARRARPSWSLTCQAALTAGALALAGVVSASCTYPQGAVHRVGGRAPVRQTGDVRRGRGRGADEVQYLRGRRLIVPVAGVQPEELHDDFRAKRSGGRRHRAIDILAPYGTPVISADDGYILRLTRSSVGGIVIYATDPEERVVYYYAHLAGYHDGLTPGKAVAKGDTIGYVGTSGNAPEDTPHLHFQITRMRSGGRYWGGEPLNPYPFLKREPKRHEPIAAQGVAPQAAPRPAEPAPAPPHR